MADLAGTGPSARGGAISYTSKRRNDPKTLTAYELGQSLRTGMYLDRYTTGDQMELMLSVSEACTWDPICGHPDPFETVDIGCPSPAAKELNVFGASPSYYPKSMATDDPVGTKVMQIALSLPAFTDKQTADFAAGIGSELLGQSVYDTDILPVIQANTAIRQV